MLEIKAYFGEWKEATKEQAESFYKTFCKGSTGIKCQDKRDYFNKHHIRGGHIMAIGKAETTEEQTERVFKHYKKRLEDNTNGKVRFSVIEYLCSFPKIDPFVMAASIINDDITILYDDSSISNKENEAKQRKVNRLLA